MEPPSSELSSQEGEEATDQETAEEEEAQAREEGESAEEEPEQVRNSSILQLNSVKWGHGSFSLIPAW